MVIVHGACDVTHTHTFAHISHAKLLSKVKHFVVYSTEFRFHSIVSRIWSGALKLNDIVSS